ncbi:MAG: transposase [Geobacteraceae bacterium]
MPRTARLVIPNHPHHIIHRGHNRQPVFMSADDYLCYIDNLYEWKIKLQCRLYAYCLMTNHVHLILDPGDNEENLAKLMKRIAGRQTRYVNKLENRSGTLWEGRYKSSPISADSYLMACCRYIELNPVRACLVDHPGSYQWSSYGEKAGENFKIIDSDPFYLGLSDDPEKRKEKYAEWVLSAIPEGELELIRAATQRGQLTGGSKFYDLVAERLGQRVEARKPGRPRKLEK